MADLYSVLGVNRNSSPEEIKAAYRKLAARYHPDRPQGDTKRFQEIQHAYDVLSDPQRRAQYDTPQNPFSGGGGFPGFQFHSAHFDLNDIFAQVFGGGMRQQHVQMYRAVVNVTLEQVYNGSETVLHVQTPQYNGVLNLTIPRGISDGAQIRYDKLIPNASLIVEYRVEQHQRYERRNQDLIIKHDISVLDLITGTQFETQTISGTTISVTVDPSTNPNANLKIHGHGLPIPGTALYGDMFVTLRPYMPSTIDPRIIDAIVQSKR